MRYLMIVFLLVSFYGLSQNQIAVEVQNVPNASGKISVALYDDADSFLEFDQVFSSGSSKAVQGTTTVMLKNIPDGTYAIALFYDKNGNDELDTNWLGIPKEKVAFSKAKMKTFGPPKFKECAFELKTDKKVVISL
ncbi:DUF2141 domain-containing protein [uncultured Croceitalea sp.]|uniref:DUF2141 domain-containing protein n=1 Tax=uncultured Croceitalea sp. TaxID=1798908 RepID=UPI00330563F2